MGLTSGVKSPSLIRGWMYSGETCLVLLAGWEVNERGTEDVPTDLIYLDVFIRSNPKRLF